METPFFGGSYASFSSNLADEICVNLYPETVETKSGKMIGALYSTPGLRRWLAIGNGPIRGLRYLNGPNLLVVVSGNTVYTVNQNMQATLIGTLVTSIGPVGILFNRNQFFVCDGINGWVCILATSTWTNTGLTNPGVATQQDGFGLVSQVGTNQFYQSNLNDLSVWDGLNFSSADSEPSNIQGMSDIFRQVWIFKGNSTEIWNNVGANGFVFQRMEGAFLQQGCAAPYSVCAADQAIIWLGRNEHGSGTVFATNGYLAQPVSTHAIQSVIATYSRIDDAHAYVYQQDGHMFYVLTFPTGNATWVYDLTIGLWHQRGEFSNGQYNRHDGACAFVAFGFNLVGSATSNLIYYYDRTYPTDDLISGPTVNPKRWQRRWRALKQPVHEPMRFGPLSIDMQTGASVGTESAAMIDAISSQNAQAELPFLDAQGAGVFKDSTNNLRIWTSENATFTYADRSSPLGDGFVAFTDPSGAVGITTPYDPKIDFAASYSFSTSVYVTDVSVPQPIWVCRNSGLTAGFQFQIYSGVLNINIVTSTGVFAVVGTTTVTTDVLHQVRLSITGRTVSLYLDGRLEGSSSYTGTYLPASTSLMTLGANNPATRGLGGWMGAVQISNPYTLTAPAECVLSWSDDGGHNFANRQLASIGAVGQTAQRVIFRRIGSTRRSSGLDRMFDLASEALRQACLLGASLED